MSGKEKLISGLGGLISILLLIQICQQALHLSQATGLIASMGASAVLLFAVPHGQLSQPWPILAGHGFSALIGVACAKWIDSPVLASACAVGLAISAMHQFKCIHPPGGATALTAVLGGSAIHDLGFSFVLFPVLANGLMMVGIAILFNFPFAWRRYPAAFTRRSGRNQQKIDSPTHERIVAALRSMDLFVDVTEEDLLHLSRLIASEDQTRNRRN